MTRILTLLFASLTTATSAQEAMDAATFDATVTGLTVTYNNSQGTFSGVEAYHPNNRVTWIGAGGVCQKGTWYQEGSEICFDYEGQSWPACWTFFTQGDTLMAAPSPDAAPWEAISMTTDPIGCTSPFVGS